MGGAGARHVPSRPTPIFLLSLPRSGSTLVQRVLSLSPGVATAPEPWLVLPLAYAARERGTWAEYGSMAAARGLNEFITRMRGGPDSFDAALARFVRSAYAEASPSESRYFLDKTPRYHYIVEDLFRLFPDGRFVFLWRNPLAVLSSIIETWSSGRWSFGRWRGDLVHGLPRLVDAYEGNRADVAAVRYEDLVSNPLSAWPALFDYLSLPFDKKSLVSFPQVQLGGRMGDQTGTRAYDALSREPLDKWRMTLSNPYRKRWARTYLRGLGEERLALMGYDLAQLEEELASVPTTLKRLGSDLTRSLYTAATERRRRAAVRLLSTRRNW